MTIKIGDKVRYYCNSQQCMREGVVSAVDVEVAHEWEFAAKGTIMKCPAFDRPAPTGAIHPLGVEINGSLTRAYYGSGKAELGSYDKARICA